MPIWKGICPLSSGIKRLTRVPLNAGVDTNPYSALYVLYREKMYVCRLRLCPSLFLKHFGGVLWFWMGFIEDRQSRGEGRLGWTFMEYAVRLWASQRPSSSHTIPPLISSRQRGNVKLTRTDRHFLWVTSPGACNLQGIKQEAAQKLSCVETSTDSFLS